MIQAHGKGFVRARCVVGAWMLLVAIVGLSAIGIAQERFRNAFNDPPTGWIGPVFKLSQAYPPKTPTVEPPSVRRWTRFDSKNATEAP
jgi:hypothetical protein